MACIIHTLYNVAEIMFVCVQVSSQGGNARAPASVAGYPRRLVLRLPRIYLEPTPSLHEQAQRVTRLLGLHTWLLYEPSLSLCQEPRTGWPERLSLAPRGAREPPCSEHTLRLRLDPRGLVTLCARYTRGDAGRQD